MKNLLIAFPVVALLLTACTKEPSLENGNGTPASGGGAAKLVQMGVRAGTDSTTTNFVYSGDVLSEITDDGTVNGQSFDLQSKIKRNSANLITSLTTISSIFPQIGLDDSLVMNFVIDNAKSQYIYGVSHYSFMGQPVADSIVYSYDASGKLVTMITYFDDGTGYSPDTKEEYTYNGSNLATIKSYTDVGTGFTLDATTTYEFDTKVNPMQFAADAPVLGMGDFYSANNATKKTVVATSPAATTITSVAYTYNSNNQPATGVNTSGSSTSTVTYHYQ